VKTPIRLVIADDHTLFRQGLRSLLGRRPGFEVVAEVERASDLLPTLSSVACDVLLLDLDLERPMLNDIEALSQVTRVVVVTDSERTKDGVAALRLGARGVVQKRSGIDTLIEAINAAAQGLVWTPPEMQAELTEQWNAGADAQLTAREGEIVRCVALGLRNAEVAKRLSITEGTVKTHLNNVFQKLGFRDRVELARYAYRVGLLGLHD
jgi:two-component system NarL family response regulator